MANIQVTKRDGHKEDPDLEKCTKLCFMLVKISQVLVPTK